MTSTNEFLKNVNVPEELKPKDSSRFSDNLYSFFSPLVKDSKSAKKSLSRYFIRANEIANTLGISKFPRSISLIQFFIGVANELDFDFEQNKYTPLITLEMETIFPKIKTISRRFKL